MRFQVRVQGVEVWFRVQVQGIEVEFLVGIQGVEVRFQEGSGSGWQERSSGWLVVFEVGRFSKVRVYRGTSLI